MHFYLQIVYTFFVRFIPLKILLDKYVVLNYDLINPVTMRTKMYVQTARLFFRMTGNIYKQIAREF